MQSFKGSMRCLCYLSPTLGEDKFALDSQFCGGYINPLNLTVMSYITLDNSPAHNYKGYICPLGQICRKKANPENAIQSFDTIYYAALQVVIVASVNGWLPLMYALARSRSGGNMYTDSWKYVRCASHSSLSTEIDASQRNRRRVKLLVRQCADLLICSTSANVSLV